MNKNKKSQSAIEFVILIGFVLFFFTVFFLTIQENMSDKLKQKTNLAVKEVALTVQDEINLASKASGGYYREFKIPDKISGRDYKINITENLVSIKTLDNKYAMALPVAATTGQINTGTNIIKKENGEIKINPQE